LMDIEEIRRKIKYDEYEVSIHAEKERYAEDVTIHDLETAIFNGDILDDYPDDPRGPTCLSSGIPGIDRFTSYAAIHPRNGFE